MKKTIIGSVFMALGTLISLSIILAASLTLSNVNQWRGSKLLYSIFSSDLDGGLSVGVPFVIGIILFIFGLSILMIELSRKSE